MNRKIVSHILIRVLLTMAFFLTLPLVVAIIYGETEVMSFFGTIILTVGLALVLTIIKSHRSTSFVKEGFAIASLSWIIMTLIGAIPFFISGWIPNFVDCIFESVSGFTTTGSTIIDNIDIMPKSILFWRNLTHYIGGLGILVFMVALIPLTNDRNMPMMRAEMPGPSIGKLVPKLRDNMRISVFIYLVLSVIQLILLLLCRMPFFDAITTVFSTAGTGGFMVHNANIAFYNSPAIEWVCAIFMMLFATNFNFFFFSYLKQWKNAFNDEIKWYVAVVFLSTFLIVVNSWATFANLHEAIRYAFFTVTSTISTTGFVGLNYELWPAFSRMIVLLLMIVGACGGSTGGGLKVSRLVILYRKGKADIKKMLHPRSIQPVTMDGKAIEPEVIQNTSTFLTLFMLIIFLGTLLVSLDNVSFETAFSSVVTCISNVGPGYDMVGPVLTFSGYSSFAKLVLSAIMLLGRLEIFPLLMLFTPGLYRSSK